MIQLADKHHITELKSIWKICFGDSDKYIDLIFSKKFKPENTLVYLSQNKVVACLQMQEYNIRIYDSIVPFYYQVGLCTLPEYRGKGYMGELIEKSFEILKQRNIPLSILVPAEDSLINYYNRFGFEETFDKGNKQIKLDQILNNSNNLDDAFDLFSRTYQEDDFCVLKNREDFEAIVEDYIEDGRPPKYNLRAMTKIINKKGILSLYAQKNKNFRFAMQIKEISDKLDVIYLIENGIVSVINKDDTKEEVMLVEERLFTRILFGYKMIKSSNYAKLFEKHKPIINLMLE